MYTLKKSLGQHFLKDETISRRIIAALEQHPFQRLLEVGPGGGAITKYLVALPGIEFRAIEIDHEKVLYLEKQFPAIQGKLIEADILSAESPFSEPFTMVGNFPYNISSQILFRVLEWRENIEGVIGMFQKEVAERVASPAGSKVYGVTSVLLQAFFKIEYLFEVSETAFNPPPKVKSAVISLRPLAEPVEIKSERSLFILVKTAFNQRRKMLRNSVKGLFDPEVLEEDMFTKRPEQITVAEFAALTFRMR